MKLKRTTRIIHNLLQCVDKSIRSFLGVTIQLPLKKSPFFAFYKTRLHRLDNPGARIIVQILTSTLSKEIGHSMSFTSLQNHSSINLIKISLRKTLFRKA